MKQKWTVFVWLEAKKRFPFVSLQCENNLVEAKWKIGSEKKRKHRTEFLKWTSETHEKRLQFHFFSLLSEKIFLAKRAHPSSGHVNGIASK